MNQLAERPDTGDIAPGGRAIRRVLIVDDSHAHQRLMATVLGRWGYEVLQATDAAAALAILDAEPVDLVLSDWIMPEMTGLDLCRAFRARGGERYVYFILLTSKSARADVANGLVAGADDFLSKPIAPEELRARISAAERLIAMQRALSERNAQLAGALDEIQSLYDAVARDLAEARRLQQSLVPEEVLAFPGAQVAMLLRPCGHVGGDLVGAFAVGDGRVCVYSIDVSGHGIASALMTARLAGYLSGSSPENNLALDRNADGTFRIAPLDEVCRRLNATILADLDTELYFTLAMVDLDLATGRAHLVQAGHPHPAIQRGDGTVEFLGDGGMPIGLFEGAPYGVFSAQLSRGDRLILYCDGFPEATTRAGEMLDGDGFAAIIGDLTAQRGADFLEALVWQLGDVTGRSEHEDDVSALVLEYAGP